MSAQYDYVVFIGRFQPPHKAHIRTIEHALSVGTNVIILAGCAEQARTIKNPWTWREREKMILDAIDPAFHSRIMVRPLRDYPYNDNKWAKAVQSQVDNLIQCSPSKIALIGYSKDASSYYLQMFPQWELIEMDNIDDLNATDIRQAYFEDCGMETTRFDLDIAPKLPEAIHNYLKAFQLKAQYEELVEEYQFIKKYKNAWKAAPYAPTFVTVDCVIVQSGHVLLVRRRAAPGKGLFAAPGGFVNQNERLVDAAIRELKEETKIKVPDPVLRGSIVATEVFDKPDRSSRGRTITHAYLMLLPPGPLPKVKGSDDAEKASWVPLSVFECMEDQMFEDHYALIQTLIEKGNQ